jgi:hypothetical protein
MLVAYPLSHVHWRTLYHVLHIATVIGSQHLNRCVSIFYRPSVVNAEHVTPILWIRVQRWVSLKYSQACWHYRAAVNGIRGCPVVPYLPSTPPSRHSVICAPLCTLLLPLLASPIVPSTPAAVTARSNLAVKRPSLLCAVCSLRLKF